MPDDSTREPGSNFAAARRWPLPAALASFWVAVALLLAQALRLTRGHFTYPLDDTYIHLATAQNLALHGIWGITRHGFTGACSSLFWPPLLAALERLFGNVALAPFALSLLCSSAFIWLALRWLTAMGLPRVHAFAGLLGVTFLTPLPVLTFFGLEHTLEALLGLSLMVLGGHLAARADTNRLTAALLLALGPVAAMTRYECLAAVTAIAVLLVTRRRWLLALALLPLAAAPVAAYGLVSVRNGWLFLPNPVLLKSGPLWDLTRGPTGLHAALGQLSLGLLLHAARHATFLAPAAVVVVALATVWRRPDPTRASAYLVALTFVGTCAAQFVGSATADFRHHAWLTAIGIVVATAALSDLVRAVKRPLARTGVLAATVLIGLPLAGRAFVAQQRLPVSSKNIHEQQYQMARFFRQYYAGESVALNDIGFVNYLADVRCLDLYGLASMDVCRLRLADEYDARAMDSIARAHGVSVAALYDSWFERLGGVPPTWRPAGRWRIPNNVACGSEEVSFYAVDPAALDRLSACLHAFEDSLPAAVGVTYSDP